MSLNIPGLGENNYLNIEAALVPDITNPSVVTLQIGRLTLSEEQATWLAGLLYEEAKLRYPEIREMEQVIEYVEMNAEELQVGIRRNQELEERLYARGREYYLPAGLRERMLIHARHLDDLLSKYDQSRLVSVASILTPMMQYARELNADPVTENRAIIMVLASYVLEIDLNQLLGISQESQLELRRVRITARGRIDYSQHFLGAAGLTLSAGNEMAELLALAKELDDTASGGSGFSFTDLGADRAGARFAELATAGNEQALLVQSRLGFSADESWFLPELQGLPEYMTDAEMQARFGGYEGPEYQAIIEELDARLSNVPMFVELRAL
jgi:hypothetical protein